jgi:hypothetical protein
MDFALWSIKHRFKAYQNMIEVTLCILSDEFREHEDSTITVTVEAADIKSLSLAQIEYLAIERAKTLFNL